MSSGRDPFDVEPLSEVRWERIERGIFERLDGAAHSVPQPERRDSRSWRSPVLLVVGAVAAAAAAAFVGSLAHRTDAPLASSHIETGADRSHVALGEATIDVGAHSGVVVTGNDAQGVLLVLEHGEIDCEVAPRRGRPPFVVQSGPVRVRVVGTRFHVGRTDAGSEVSVTHGTVEVMSGDKVVEVHAGERWGSNDTSISEANPAQRFDVAEGASSAPTNRHGQAPHPHTHASPSPSASAPSRFDVAPAHSADVSAARSANELAPMPNTSARSVREEYEAAARLEASDPSAALARYRELSRGDDAWAANALYAEGRLAADRGDRERAERVLREYLVRFPSGPNASDARELMSRISAKRR